MWPADLLNLTYYAVCLIAGGPATPPSEVVFMMEAPLHVSVQHVVAAMRAIASAGILSPAVRKPMQPQELGRVGVLGRVCRAHTRRGPRSRRGGQMTPGPISKLPGPGVHSRISEPALFFAILYGGVTAAGAMRVALAVGAWAHGRMCY